MGLWPFVEGGQGKCPQPGGIAGAIQGRCTGVAAGATSARRQDALFTGTYALAVRR